jgi:hypothetical protein
MPGSIADQTGQVRHINETHYSLAGSFCCLPITSGGFRVALAIQLLRGQSADYPLDEGMEYHHQPQLRRLAS